MFRVPATPAPEGIRLHVIPNRPHAAVGVMGVPTLTHLVPNPKREEDARALRHGDAAMRRHARMRAEVQRVLKSSPKGKNVEPYARYLADALNGHFGEAYSTPPVTLWLADVSPRSVSEEIIPDTGICLVTISPGSPVIAIDGETQVTAWHELAMAPETFGITKEQLDTARVPFEIYFDINVDDAQQIFHDRNVKGVAVTKNFAMSMDQRDLATQIARALTDAVNVEHNGTYRPLRDLVEFRKRQLDKSGNTLVTLSALRELVIATLLGRRGIAMSSTGISSEELPVGVSVRQANEEVLPLLTRVLEQLLPHLAAQSVVSAPAVLSGLGVAAHQAISWSKSETPLKEHDLLELIQGVRWERDLRYWEGIAGGVTRNGTLSVNVGSKVLGGRVADALLNPDSPNGQKIRGRI